MVEGWQPLQELERLGAKDEIDSGKVASVCDQVQAINQELRSKVVDFLRQGGHGKWADGVAGAFRASDERLFNCYFSNRAYSFAVPATPPDRLDGCRAAVVFHLADQLQNLLLDHLRGLPTADVMNARHATDPDAFSKVFKFTNLRAIVDAVKSVQSDVEDFAFRSEDLLVGTDGSRMSFRSTCWPYDADVMVDQVLLGFIRGPSPSVLNSVGLSSPVVAAGMVRSHLETVLFRIDFKASIHSSRPVQASSWDEALKQHRDARRLPENMVMWTTEAYGLLSASLHTGLLLTRGEIWAINRLVDIIRDKLASSEGGSK